MKKLYRKSFMMLIAFMMAISLSAQNQVLILEDFEGISSGIPSGWSRTGTQYGHQNWDYNFYDETGCLGFNNKADAGLFGVLYSPTISLPFQEMYLSFDYIKEDGSGDCSVYVSTDGGATNGEVLLDLNNTGKWAHVEVSLAKYREMSNVKIVFVGLSIGVQNYVYLDNVKVETVPLCSEPTNIYVSTITKNSATLSWGLKSVGSIPDQYKVRVVSENGDTIVDSDTEKAVGNTLTITGLSSNVEYSVFLQSDCRNSYKGVSDWAEPFKFTTPCEAITLPQNYTFVSEEENTVPFCWMVGGANKDEVKIVVGGIDHTDDTYDNCLKLSTTTSSDSYIALPAINHAAEDIEVSFHVKGTVGAPLQVALVTDVADLSTAVPFLEESVPYDNRWYEFVANTSTTSYAGQTGLYLIFYSPAGHDADILIDNISVNPMPTCVRPQDILVSDVTDNDATIAWTSHSGQNLGNYQVRFTAGGLVPYIVNVNGAEILNEANLVPNTNYTVQVRQICSVGDTSAWSCCSEFTTRCSPIVDFPYIESFESGAFPYDCWKTKQIVKGNGGYGTDFGDESWRSISASLAPYYGPQKEGAYDGNNVLEMRTCYRGAHTIAVMPYMTFASATSHEVRFWMYRGEKYNSVPQEGVNIWVNSQNDTVGGTKLGFVSNFYEGEPVVAEIGWYQYTFPLPMAGNGFIIIEGISQNAAEIYIDHVEVRERPTCLSVLKVNYDSVSTDKAYFSWDVEPNASNEWIFKCKMSYMSEPFIDTVSTTNYVITGLHPNTTYSANIEVLSYCGVNDESEEKKWNGDFHTQCMPASLPFIENFDNNFDLERKNCWSYPVNMEAYGSIYPKVEDTDNTFELHTQDHNAFATPELVVDSWVGKRIYMDVYGKNGPIQVGTMTNPMDVMTFDPIDTIEITSVKQTYYIDVTTEHVGRYVGFFTGYEDYYRDDDNYFDNIRIMNTPACPDIDDFNIGEEALYSASVNITDDVNAAWEVQYGAIPFNEATAVTVPVTSSTYSIINLIPDTKYAVRVRSVCNLTDKGNWTDFKYFKTQCLAFHVTEASPLFDGFEEGQVDQKEVGGCWLVDVVSTEEDQIWLANSSLTNYNREPYEGLWNAYLGNDDNEQYLIYALELDADINYQFSCFARTGYTEQDKSVKKNISVSICTNLDDAATDIAIVREQDIPGFNDYRKYSNFFSVPNAGTYYLKVGVNMTGQYRNYVSVDNVKVEVVSCAPPTLESVIYNGISHQGVDMQWHADASRFVYKLDTKSIDPESDRGIIYNDTLNAASFSTSVLSPSTTYYYYIKAICGANSESDWSKEGTFTTNCAPFTLPYTETFDDGAPNIGCWRSLGGNALKLSTAQKLSGSHSLSGSGVTLATPDLDIATLTDKQLSMHLYSEMDTVKVAVGVISNLNDVSTYELINEIEITKKNKWVEVVTYFDILNDPDYSDFAGSKNIVLTISEDYTVYVDNIDIRTVVTCPVPTFMTFSNLTSNSATIDWSSKEETSWNLRLMSGENCVLDSVVTSLPVTINNLEAITEYEVEVRAICSSVDTSDMLLGYFTTMCLDAYGLPFEENFNSLQTNENVSCWINDVSAERSSNMWRSYAGVGTPTPSYEFYSDLSGETVISTLKTPQISLVGQTNATLSFDLQNQTYNSISVYLSIDGGATYVDTLVAEAKMIAAMRTFKFDISEYCGNNIVIAFAGEGKSDKYVTNGTMRIDNVNVFVPTTCMEPQSVELTTIITDSVGIQISDSSDCTQWEIAVLRTNVDTKELDESDIISTSSKTLTVYGLAPTVNYVIYARSVCGEERSRWIMSDVLTPACGPVILPYSQNFNEATHRSHLKCIDITGEFETTQYPEVLLSKSSYEAYDGGTTLELEAGLIQYLYFVFPEINAPLDTVSMSFLHRNDNLSGGAVTLEVGALPLSLDTAQFVSLYTAPLTTVYTENVVEFVNSKLKKGYRVAFRVKTNDSYKSVLIDNVEFDYRETCIAPSGVELVETSGNTAVLHVVDEANSQWEVAYGPIGENFSDLSVLSNQNSNDITLTGLQAATKYQVYVRALCGGDNTAWSNPTIFTTECTVKPISESNPYIEDFNSYIVGEIPVCWTRVIEYSGYYGVVPCVGKNYYTGDMELSISEGSGTAIATPQFSVPVNRLYMDVSISGENSSSPLYIGYTDDVSDPDAIKLCYSLLPTGPELRYTFDMTVAPSTATNIVFQTLDYTSVSIDSVKFYIAPDCFTPSAKGVDFQNVTSNGVDIQFATSVNHSSMEYVITRNGASLQTAWTSANPVLITGLEASTEYGIVYRSACNDNGQRDTAAWSDTVYFSTTSVPAALPYVYGFEDAAENANWKIVGEHANQWIISSKDQLVVPYETTALYVSNDDSTYHYDASTSSYSWAYRTFNLEKGIYSLSYLCKVAGEESDNLRVFFVPSSKGYDDRLYTDFVDADNGEPIYNQKTWAVFNKLIAIEKAGYYDLAFRWKNNEYNETQTPAAIDNIELTHLNCGPVTSCDIEALGSTSATVKLNGLMSNPIGYQIVVKTLGGDPTPAEMALATEYPTETIELTGLDPQTSYNIFARTICSVGDTSIWSESMSFVTKCTPDTITYLNPFFESFENYANNDVVSGDCWEQVEYIKSEANGDPSWVIMSDAYISYKPHTGKMTTALSGGNDYDLKRNVYLEAGATYTVKAWTYRHGADLSARLTFSMVDMNGNSTTVISHVPKAGDYQKLYALFVAPSDGAYEFVIHGHAGDAYGAIVLDDVSLERNMCVNPTNLSVSDITATSANITWTASSESTHIELLVGEEQIDTTVTCHPSGTNTLTLSNLTPASNYAVNIYNMCDRYTSEVISTNFTTECALIELPYYTGFDTYKGGVLPSCWDNSESTADANYVWRTGTNGRGMGLRFDSKSSVKFSTSTLKSVEFDVDDSDYSISFDYLNPDGGEFSVYLSTDSGATYADTILDAVTNVKEWSRVIMPLSRYNGARLTVVFHSVSNAGTGNAYHYVDNLRIAPYGGESNYYASTCANEPFGEYGFTVSAVENAVPGTYRYTRFKHAENDSESDSTIVLNLTVNPTYNVVSSDNFCEGTVYSKGLFQNISEVGTYVCTYQSVTGCDSLVTLHLKALDLDTTLAVTICEGDSVEFFGKYYKEHSVYTNTVTAGECMSVQTLILTVRPKYYELTDHICEGESYEFAGVTYTESGRYVDSLTNSLGCDSIRILNLTVHGLGSTLDTALCEGQTILFNGENIDSTGVYSFTYQNEWGCDSIATLNLTITPADTSVVNDYVCEGKEYYDYGFAGLSITQDTIVYSRGQSSEGCDSIVELHLSLSLTEEVYDTVVIREGEKYPFGGNDLTTAGDYDHAFQNSLGCDSIVYLHLNVSVGLGTIEARSLTLAPNPVSAFGQATIYRDWTVEEQEGMHLDVLDAVGRVLYTTSVTDFPVTVSSLGVSGMYYVRITAGTGEVFTGKLIVK